MVQEPEDKLGAPLCVVLPSNRHQHIQSENYLAVKLVMPPIPLEELSELLQRRQIREQERHERIRKAVASAPAPLPAELADAIIRLRDEPAHVIMREHPGYKLAERRASYRISIAIMKLSTSDLLAAINDFATRVLAEGSTLFDRHKEAEVQAIELRIQKELFATADAAASLVDHSRRLLKHLALVDYEARLRLCFGADGLHEFVIALRVLLHHLHMVEAGWNVNYNFSEGTKSATFSISKATLLRTIPEHDLSRREVVLRYVTSQSESIDLKAVFEEYHQRVALFHQWLCEQLTSDTLVALRDYDWIMQEKKNHGRRLWWNALLGNWLRNWKKPPNPHDHLHKYLTKAQLSEVYALPRNSKEQVDLIISFVDEEGAIDDKLRAKAYELFERSPLRPE